MDKRINSELPPILNTCSYFKNIGGQWIFFSKICLRKYISLWGNQRMGNLISLSGLPHFMEKKRWTFIRNWNNKMSSYSNLQQIDLIIWLTTSKSNIIHYLLKFDNFCLIKVELRTKCLFANQPLAKTNECTNIVTGWNVVPLGYYVQSWYGYSETQPFYWLDIYEWEELQEILSDM